MTDVSIRIMSRALEIGLKFFVEIPIGLMVVNFMGESSMACTTDLVNDNKPNVMSIKPTVNTPGGYNGDYYKISETVGLKALRHYMAFSPNNVDMTGAETEANYQRKAREILGDIVPEVHGVGIVRVEGEDHYYPCILMQHIEGKTLFVHYGPDCPKSDDVAREMYRKMCEAGVDKNDCHDLNFMIDAQGKIYAIDWGGGATFLTLASKVG